MGMALKEHVKSSSLAQEERENQNIISLSPYAVLLLFAHHILRIGCVHLLLRLQINRVEGD